MVNMVIAELEKEDEPDPRRIQINLEGFLDKNSANFTAELWKLLLSAQENYLPGQKGIPTELIQNKLDDFARKEQVMTQPDNFPATAMALISVSRQEFEHRCLFKDLKFLASNPLPRQALRQGLLLHMWTRRISLRTKEKTGKPKRTEIRQERGQRIGRIQTRKRGEKRKRKKIKVHQQTEKLKRKEEGHGIARKEGRGTGKGRCERTRTTIDREERSGKGIDQGKRIGKGIDRGKRSGKGIDRRKRSGRGIDRGEKKGRDRGIEKGRAPRTEMACAMAGRAGTRMEGQGKGEQRTQSGGGTEMAERGWMERRRSAKGTAARTRSRGARRLPPTRRKNTILSPRSAAAAELAPCRARVCVSVGLAGAGSRRQGRRQGQGQGQGRGWGWQGQIAADPQP